MGPPLPCPHRPDPTVISGGPATAHGGDLTHDLSGALQTCCRTDAAAATALSLHLNLPPAHFELLRLADVAPDGSAIRGPTTTTLHQSDNAASTARMIEAGRVGDEVLGWSEFCCPEPILIPAPAHPVFAAHRAYRVGQGATDEDPLFTHPRQPGRRSTERLLRELIRRSCHKLGIDPPWMHGGDCRYGADAGLIRRRYGWMIERGLALLMINPEHPVQFPQPPCIAPPGRVRPHRTQCDQR